MSMVEGCLAQAEKKLQKEKSQDFILSDNRPMIGTLEVRVLEAKKLAGSDRIRIRPGLFCVLSLENQTIRSKASQSWPPKWDQEMMFSVFSLDEALKIQLFNYDRYSKDGIFILILVSFIRNLNSLE
jgi:Ca2+-dependent lipid-binding protein